MNFKILFILTLAVSALSSCAPTEIDWFESDRSELQSQIVLLPEEIDTGDRFADEDQEELETPPESVQKPQPKPKPPRLRPAPGNRSGNQKTTDSELNQKILLNAEYVLRKERNIPGIGDACNFFIQRILRLSGFSKKGWLANDFDLYAAQAFKGHRIETYEVEPDRRDAPELDRFLRSYPEGTPFILQWERSKGRGHVALVNRVGNDLVIYEASLGRFNAKKKITTARTILSASDRYRLNVYVGFMPSGKE